MLPECSGARERAHERGSSRRFVVSEVLDRRGSSSSAGRFRASESCSEPRAAIRRGGEGDSGSTGREGRRSSSGRCKSRRGRGAAVAAGVGHALRAASLFLRMLRQDGAQHVAGERMVRAQPLGNRGTHTTVAATLLLGAAAIVPVRSDLRYTEDD